MGRKRLRVFAIFVLSVLASTLLVGASQARTVSAPSGKQNWVVSVGGFRTDADRNYVRLGYLVFDPADNTVAHNFWTWSQADFPVPVDSGDVYYCGDWAPGTNPRNNCPIKTAPGFTGAPNGHFTGTYAETAGQVAITWTSSTLDGTTTAVNLAETWAVSETRPGLGRLQLVSDNYSITSGIAYGSNASLAQTSKAPMSSVRATQRSYLLEGQGVNRRAITNWTRGSSGALGVGPGWNKCDDGSCLGFVQYDSGCDPSSCCPAGPGYEACARKIIDTGDRRFYYLSDAFGGRRNSYEFWCECLSYNGCYLGNSHVRPLLQVIDDAGAFQGWVGAEVSPDRSGSRDPSGEYYSTFALVA
ncbi:hypothetical protein [Amycolatopsis decaplanina]|uniref:Uncharacterized protein n=1 Tax=Amycolatopsis decaplanina DSM 44594 TaxID=1284240 RepID=M2YRB6_9PSEU|nr:hypothetical protein [Amycolatopsis decaplanina]EME57402.1 hypothetical protein H074_19467 [Amycolatopsis decaplanina DSM 44594]